MKKRLPVSLIIIGLTLATLTSSAEQMQRFGGWEVHYVVLPTGFLNADIASRYDVIRGRDRAFVNVSVLDSEGQPTQVAIAGHVTNLLGQQQTLAFRKVAEDRAVYYLADIKHSNEEVLRFKITVVPPGERDMLVEFQQKLYWEEP